MLIQLLFIGFIFISFSHFIKNYNKYLIKIHKEYYTCHDIMNIKICSILGFPMCVWNFIHIIIYCLVCVLFNAKLDTKRHLYVFMTGVAWYLLCPYSEHNHKHKKCKGTVYKDTFIPRLDDLVFNTLGQLLYIFLYKTDMIKVLMLK